MNYGAGKSGPVPVRVTKKADDPICPRVSAGGHIELGGFYCTYRGSLQEAIAVLETVLVKLKSLSSEPAISPDDGRHYA